MSNGRIALETPWFGTISFETGSRPTAGLEQNPLFGSLREHLPFATLWRDYSLWTDKVARYIDGCKGLLEETQQEAKTSSDPEINKIAGDVGSIHTAEALALTKPLAQMMKKYRARAESQPKPLSDEIRILGEKLVDSLQEILLRRDYIVYTCKLCPGQLRPLR